MRDARFSSVHHGSKTDYTMQISFHGAAMAKDGCACIFLCPTEGGKSTLSLYLYQNGYEYISDDRVEVTTETQTVTGRYKPIELRPGGYRLLRSLGVLSGEEVEFDAFPSRERYRFYPQKSGNTAVPLREIFLINRTEEHNGVRLVEKSEAIRIMMENVMEPVPVNGEYLRALSFLAEKMRSEVSYCNLSFLTEVLERGTTHEQYPFL